MVDYAMEDNMKKQLKIQELHEFVQSVDKLNWFDVSESDKNKFRRWDSMFGKHLDSKELNEFETLTEKLYRIMEIVKSKKMPETPLFLRKD